MRSSSQDPFSSRGRALEDEFFHERDQQLLANLRNELAELEEEHQLAHVSGIMDQKVLADMMHCGVTAESLLATRMIPMIAVAWADHVIKLEEREAILKAAEQDNIQPGSAAYDLLLSWLVSKPRPEVFIAWKEYVRELVKVSPPETVKELRERTVRLCNEVARCGKNFWLIGTIPEVAKRTIDEYAHVWDRID
jgi:hypothetical protein